MDMHVQKVNGGLNCGKCGEIVDETSCVKINGMVWHLKCFRCNNCNQTLTEPGYQEGTFQFKNKPEKHRTTSCDRDTVPKNSGSPPRASDTFKIGCTPQMYPRRLGTYDTGKEYETKMVALLALRCVALSNTEDIWLANNLDGVGDFDDIVLYRRANDGRTTIYMLQIKHQSNPTTIETRDFVRAAGKKSFCLAKYNRCYEQLKKKIDECPDETFECLRSAHEIAYVLYTNKTVAHCDFLVNNTRSGEDLRFLNTTGIADEERSVYKFKHNLNESVHCNFLSNLDLSFLRKLVIFSDQAHIDDMSGLIKNTIRSLVKCDDPSLSFDWITKVFVSFVKVWARDRNNSSREHYALTRCDVIDKLMHIILYPYRLKLGKDPVGPLNSNALWEEIIATKPATIIEATPQVLHFLKQYIAVTVDKFCKTNSVPTWGSIIPDDTKEEFLSNPRYKMLHSKMLGYKKKMTLVDVYELLWIDEKLPLLLEIDNERDYKIITDVLGSFEYGLSVIMVVRDFVPSNLGPQHFRTLDDLSPKLKTKVLSKQVRLQGRSAIGLQDIVGHDDRTMCLAITSKDLVEILCNTFSIGNNLEAVPNDFVPRRISKVVLRAQCVKDLHEEMFIVRDDTRRRCDKNVIWVDNESAFCDALRNLKVMDRPVHYLAYYDYNSYEWLGSCGTTRGIARYVIGPGGKKSLPYDHPIASPVDQPSCDRSASVNTMRPSSYAKTYGTRQPLKTIRHSDYERQTPHEAASIRTMEPSHRARNMIPSCDLRTSRTSLWHGSSEMSPKTFVYDIGSYKKRVRTASYTSFHDTTNLTTMSCPDIFTKGTPDVPNKDLQCDLRSSSWHGSYGTNLPEDRKSLLRDRSPAINFLHGDLRNRSSVKRIYNGMPSHDMDGMRDLNTTSLKTNTGYSCTTSSFREGLCEDDCSSKLSYDNFKMSYGCTRPSDGYSSLSRDRSSPYTQSSLSRGYLGASRDHRSLPKDHTSPQQDCSSPSHGLLYPSHDLSHLSQNLLIPSHDNMTSYVVSSSSQASLSIPYLFPGLVHIISSQPGSGKSTILNNIAQNTPTDTWVIKIDLRLYDTYYEELQHPKFPTPNATEHLQRIVHDILSKNDGINMELALAVFHKLLRYKKIMLLLDGFDEIAVTYKEEVTKVIASFRAEGFYLWITTRPITRAYLEEKFDTIARDLEPFDAEDQRHFLSRYMTEDYSESDRAMPIVEQFIERLQNISSNLGEFAGNPLQARIVAEVFYDDFKASLEADAVLLPTKLDSVHLYERFARKKLDVLVSKYGEDSKRTRKLFQKQQQLLALKTLFDRQYLTGLGIDEKIEEYRRNEDDKLLFLQREGIIVAEQDKPERYNLTFVDETFAEYLAACWLAENTPNRNEAIRKIVKNIIKLRFHPYGPYKFLFAMYDRILCEGSELHLAILDRRYDVIKLSVYREGHVLDKGGRTFVHVLALNGTQHPLDKIVHFDKIDDEMALILEEIQLGPIEDDYLGFSPLDYAVASRSLAVADKICRKTQQALTASMSKNDSIFFHCAVFEYKSLFKVLLLNNASNDLLWRYVDKNKTIITYLGERDHISDPLRQFCEAAFGPFCTLLQLFQIRVSFKRHFYQDLRFAAAFGTKTNVDFILKSCVEVNEVDLDGNTALHYAAIHGRKRMVEYLIERGADVTRIGYDGNTALHFAAEYGNNDVVGLLISAGADVNGQNDFGNTALQLALRERHLETAGLLLNKGGASGVNFRNKSGEAALHRAILTDDRELIDTIMQKSDISVMADAMFVAFTHRDVATLMKIPQNAPITQIRDRYGNTGLHHVARGDLPDMVHRFLSANLDQANLDGETPLHVAIRSKSWDVAAVLVENGADCDASNANGNAALHLAVAGQRNSLVRRILATGADVNKQNNTGNTPLHCAILHGNVKAALILLTNAVTDCDRTNRFGCSVLHYAARMGDYEIVRKMLGGSKTTDINKQDNYGNTALHYAASEGYTDVVELFLKTSLIKNTLKNGADKTAQDLAIHHNHRDVIKLFESFSPVKRKLEQYQQHNQKSYKKTKN